MRFANNVQLPVMEYGELDIQSTAGLRYRSRRSCQSKYRMTSGTNQGLPP